MKHVPNIITLLNLLCGCMAIVSMFYSRFDQAAILVLIALILDYLDGFAARALNVHSELGKQLDSLADMVTFGVVPGMVLYHLFLQSSFFASFDSKLLFTCGKYSMFIVTLFSCLRLGNFNIDPRQSTYFIGVPTPLNTMMIISLPLILSYDRFGLSSFILNPFTLVGIACISSWLLVAEIPLISLKLKSLKWKDNQPQIILLVGCLGLILLFAFAAPPMILLFYVLLSLIYPPNKVKQV
jgi:CDP-diacylglycerol--serine O-phosphatidyltransferase